MKQGYERIEFSLHPAIAKLLEEVRGQVPRAVFVRSLLRDYLEDALGRDALASLPPEEEERPGGRRTRTPKTKRIDVEFLLHPEMAKLLDEVRDLPRATFIRSLIKAYLRDTDEFLELDAKTQTLLKNE